MVDGDQQVFRALSESNIFRRHSMHFISPYPPVYLEQVAEHCPKALSTYMRLWKDRNQENLAKYDIDNFRETHLISRAKFRHDLFLLAKECLVNIKETSSQIIVELVDWNDEEIS